MTAPTGLLHYEDFDVGMVIDLGSYPVTAEEIVSFANEFDPHPFHLDEEAGRKSILGGRDALDAHRLHRHAWRLRAHGCRHRDERDHQRQRDTAREHVRR